MYLIEKQFENHNLNYSVFFNPAECIKQQFRLMTRQVGPFYKASLIAETLFVSHNYLDKFMLRIVFWPDSLHNIALKH